MKEIFDDRKRVWEHISPDGDKCEFTVVISNDRKYCQWQRYKKVEVGAHGGMEDGVEKETVIDYEWRPDGNPFVIDGPFLLDSADAYRECTSVIPLDSQAGRSLSVLQEPQITDHRQTRSDKIEKQVAESMNNMDDTKPVHTFTSPEMSAEPTNYDQFRTGVDVEAMPDLERTPEEWALEKKGEGLKQWQKDAITRKQAQRPIKPPRMGGQVRPQFKKVIASEII